MANFLGTALNDVLFSTAGNDNVNGGAGDDVIIASTGSDIYQGGSGYDTVFYNQLTQPITLQAFGSVVKGGGTGTDSLRSVERVVATNGIGDTIDASAAGFPATGITINLQVGRVDVLGLPSGPLGFDVSGFENVTGSALADTITGDDQANLIMAGGGNDVVFGGGGVDTINGGTGNDVLIGGAGNDVITGGLGNDVFRLSYRSSHDRITDFSASAVGNNDTFALSDNLDAGWSNATTGGITGLVFEGSFEGARLAPSSFFKGAGLTGAGLGYSGGIFVNTLNGEVRFNGGPAAGN
ncbi:MAG: calcium-binding protein, partial [Cyanobacteriota bacterium]|nr:calcium-binding protein [Cyanobacteriota bacterium]